MGRGILYPHPHKVLVLFSPNLPDEEDDDELIGQLDWDDEWEDFWENLKYEIQEDFGAWENYKYIDREASVWLSTDRYDICRDFGGEVPCIYLQPREYYDYVKQVDVEYKIDKDAVKFFNKLIESYPIDTFGYPINSIQAQVYGKKKSGFQWYGFYDSRTESKPYTNPKWFVGCHKLDKSYRKAFESWIEPTEKTHPEFGAVIGPFKTKRAARYCAQYGYNSGLQHVDEYEEAARKQAETGYPPLQRPLFEIIE